MDELVLLDIEVPIAIITINRKDAANALSAEVRQQLFSALEIVRNTPSVRVLILTAAGEKVFAAGSDIKDMVDMNGQESIALSESILRLNNQFASLDIPVICAINGWCLGGGLELALACDIRIAADHARFGFPEPRLGIMPGAGGVPRLLRTVGGGVARYMLLTGEILDARRAYDTGLVTSVVAMPELLNEARAMGLRIAALGPTALAQIKHTVSVAESADLAGGIEAETQACAVCFASPEKREGMTAFIAKRKPDFAAAATPS
jgi:enoyl-CoA hydratase/carnithine racemase